MSDYIIVEEVIEDEDGSAKIKVNLPEDTVQLLLNEALAWCCGARPTAWTCRKYMTGSRTENHEPRQTEPSL